MRQKVLLDTGLLVAFINRREQLHDWVLTQWKNIEPPLFTCEPVSVEACFLLQDIYRGAEQVLSLLNIGVVQIPFSLTPEVTAIEELIRRYQSVPMSLADACLVRMAELNPKSELLTLDSDFTIYRQNRNQVISVIMP